MSIHFTSMTVSQITDRAHKLMDEGTALAQLAAALVQFEESTGRKLFVSEADPGVSYVGRPREVEIRFQPDRGVMLPEVAAGVDTPVEPAAEAATQEPIKKDPPAIAAPSTAKPVSDQKAIKKPELQPTAAPTAAKPQTTERPWGSLNLAARRIVKHLEGLPQAFTAAEDLRLVELLTGGHKTPIAAAIMDMPADQIVARWQAFMCLDVLGANGKPSIDGQKHLLAALRYRKDAANV